MCTKHTTSSQKITCLISHEFFEDLVDNDPIYSIQFQKKIIKAFSTLQNKGILTQKKCACSILHAGIYIFSVCADYDQNIRMFDSHPTPTKLRGNGTGVVVSSQNPHFKYEWIVTRLRCSKRNASVTSFLMFVKAEKR